jgi:hypothetical protein
VTLVAIAVVALAGLAPAAQGLAGTALRPVENADTVVGGLIDYLVSGKKRDPKPVIDRAVVKEDSPGRIVVVVSYSGLAGCRLATEVRGANRRRQSDIQSEPVELAAAAGEATLVLDARAPSPGEPPVESAFLAVTASEVGPNGLQVVSRLFRLPKRWHTTATPQAAQGTPDTPSPYKVVAEPIGTAAGLGPRPDYTPPPKVLVPMKGLGAAAPIVRDQRRTAEAVGVMTAPPPRAAGGGGVQVTPTPPGVQSQRRATREKTTAVTRTLPQRAAVMGIDRFKYGIKPEDVQKGALGPASSPIELLEGLRTEDIDLNPAMLLSIASNIYPDRNPESGVFYYHPRSYHLEWSPESGHGMRILYGAAPASGGAGDVLMAARLQSGLDLAEVQLATLLLDAYKRRTRAEANTVLRPLPLEKDGLDVSFGAVLGQYSIPKEKIAITGLSDVLGEIEVSWVTDPVTKENIQLALAQDVGVSGMVSFAAVGGTMAPQVPVAIQLADRDSFGRVRWNRAEGFRNTTPYPVRLRYVHALVINPVTNLPILYSWSLGQAEVPPQGAVVWDARKVPAWIDTEAKRVWIDYGVVQTCDPCDRQVLDTITGGVTSIAAEQITFHTIKPLADVGGYEITAHVRSKYFDPKDRALLQKSVVLKADNEDFTLRPIYAGTRPVGEPFFEYRLELTMPDGAKHVGTRWIASDDLRVLIGRVQLEQSGALPGKMP